MSRAGVKLIDFFVVSCTVIALERDHVVYDGQPDHWFMLDNITGTEKLASLPVIAELSLAHI